MTASHEPFDASVPDQDPAILAAGVRLHDHVPLAAALVLLHVLPVHADPLALEDGVDEPQLLLGVEPDHRLHVVFLLHAVFDGDDPILHSELLLSLHGKIRPQVNVFSFDRLTGHETHVGEFFLYGQNQFCRSETH